MGRVAFSTSVSEQVSGDGDDSGGKVEDCFSGAAA